MDISLTLLLDELGFDADTNLTAGELPRFEAVEMFSPKGADLSGRKLLVCTLSEALAVSKRDGLYFLCVRDRMVDDYELPQTMHGITVIRRNIDVRELFNRAQRVFMKVIGWVLAMESSLSRHQGLQELLTLSEPIFRNHISIQDATFKLIAATQGIDPNDNLTYELLRLGYHPPETIQLFQRLRRIEEYGKSRDIVVSTDRATSHYDVVKKMFHCDSAVSLLVVMICCGREATPGLLELFRILLGYIEFYVEQDFGGSSGGNAKRALAMDLIAKNVVTPEEARIRANYAGLPFEDRFSLAMLVFQDKENVPFSRLIQAFSDAFPRSVVFSNGRHLLLLDISRRASDGQEWQGEIVRRASGQGFRCGISNDFHCLWDIGIAYEQALLAVNTASSLHRAADEVDEPTVQFCAFRDLWIYHLLTAGVLSAPDSYKNSFLFRAPQRLRAYDEAHGTNTLELLREYLSKERKATVVSESFHMHRNTVLYHVNKIEGILNVSLDDPDTRLKLLLAYKAEDLRAGGGFPFHY